LSLVLLFDQTNEALGEHKMRIFPTSNPIFPSLWGFHPTCHPDSAHFSCNDSNINYWPINQSG